MLVLKEHEITGLVCMEEAIDTLEGAFQAQDAGLATNRPRDRVRAPGGSAVLHMLGAALEHEGLIGFKAYTTARGGAYFLLMLFSSDTGAPVAMIEADRLGQLRTGAATGLATRLMSRLDAYSVGIYGSGYQAETQLEAVCAVRSITSAVVYSPHKEKRDAFAARMSERLHVDITSVNRPEDAAEADILVTATTSREPVLLGEWLSAGIHINTIGANNLNRREIDDEVVRRADAVVVDSREQALKEAADLISPMERGWLTWERVRELREVVSGARSGRSSREDITLFKSLGIGLEDIALGGLVYRKAIAAGLGSQVSFLD